MTTFGSLSIEPSLTVNCMHLDVGQVITYIDISYLPGNPLSFNLTLIVIMFIFST